MCKQINTKLIDQIQAAIESLSDEDKYLLAEQIIDTVIDNLDEDVSKQLLLVFINTFNVEKPEK